MADSPFMRPFYRMLAGLLTGRLDEGFEWLETSFAAKEPLLCYLPNFCIYRGTEAAKDPRFDAACERLGIVRVG